MNNNTIHIRKKKDADEISKRHLKSMSIFDYINYALLFLIVLIMIYPFVFVVAGSFSNGQDYLSGGVWLFPRIWTLANYQVIVSDDMLWVSYKNTIIKTALGSLSAITFTSIVAYAMSRKELKFRRTFQILNLITMFFSGGLIPFFTLIYILGLYDKFLVYIIPSLYSVYNMIILSTGYASISDEMHEAAIIDGAGELRIWGQIYLPLCKAVHATVILWLIVGHWNSYYNTMIYTSGEAHVITLQYYLMGVINRANYVPEVGGEILDKVTSKTVGFAAIVIVVLPVLFMYPFLSKYFTKGAFVGSLKG